MTKDKMNKLRPEMEEQVDLRRKVGLVGGTFAAELFQHNPKHQRETEFAYEQIRRSRRKATKTKNKDNHHPVENILGRANEKNVGACLNFNSSASEFLPSDEKATMGVAYTDRYHNRSTNSTFEKLEKAFSFQHSDDESTFQRTLEQHVDQHYNSISLGELSADPLGQKFLKQRLKCVFTLLCGVASKSQLMFSFEDWKRCSLNLAYEEKTVFYLREAGARRLKVSLAAIHLRFSGISFYSWKLFVADGIAVEQYRASVILAKAFRYHFLGGGLFRKVVVRNNRPLILMSLSDFNLRNYPISTYARFHYEVLCERKRQLAAAIFLQTMARMSTKRYVYCKIRSGVILFQTIFRGYRMRLFFTNFKKRTTLIQARMRMYRSRQYFLALRNASISAQSQWRGYESRARFLDTLRAVNMIQFCFRCHIIRKNARQQRNKERLAALTIQRMLYVRNGQITTFVLLGCLREIGDREKEFERSVIIRFRAANAREIQRKYRSFIFNRRMNASIRIQCRYRSILAVSLLRNLKSAKVQNDKKTAASSRIAFCWLKSKRGRLSNHLVMRTLEEEKKRAKLLKRHRRHSARVIQSYTRRYLASRFCDRLRARYRFRSIVVAYSKQRFALTKNRVIRRGVSFKVVQRFRHESILILVKVEEIKQLTSAITLQRAYRAYAFQCQMNNQVERKLRENRCALRIQKCIRHYFKSMHERVSTLALTRNARNPFRKIDDIGMIVREFEEQTIHVYHPNDERCGMALATFMQRLGMIHDIFPMLSNAGIRSTEELFALSDDDFIDVGVFDETQRNILLLSSTDFPSSSFVHGTTSANPLTKSETTTFLDDFKIIEPEQMESTVLALFGDAYGPSFVSRAQNFARGPLSKAKVSKMQLKHFFSIHDTPAKAKEKCYQLMRPRVDDDRFDAIDYDRMQRYISTCLYAMERITLINCNIKLTDCISSVQRQMIRNDPVEDFKKSCKLLYESLHHFYKIFCAARDVQRNTRGWIGRKLFSKLREKAFLEKMKSQYAMKRKTNHVKNVWASFRAQEQIEYESYLIDNELQSVMRYGWRAVSRYDHGEETMEKIVYINQSLEQGDFPSYTFKQYTSSTTINRLLRGFLARGKAIRTRVWVLRSQKKEEQRICWNKSHEDVILNVDPDGSHMHVKVKYHASTLPFGWMIDPKSGHDSAFVHKQSGNVVYLASLPLYTFDHIWAVTLVQSAWRGKVEKEKYAKMLQNESVITLVRKGIQKASDICWYGYEYEGMSLLLWLSRLGMHNQYASVSEGMNALKERRRENSKRRRKKNLYPSNLSTILSPALHSSEISHRDAVQELRDFIRRSKNEKWLATIGFDVKEIGIVQKVRDFYPHQSTKEFEFINYFDNARDARSLSNCVSQSYNEVYHIMLKKYKNNTQRVKRMTNRLLESNFPITFGQIEAFLQRYEGKPRLAQENIGELMDIPTLADEADEFKAYHVLKACVEKVASTMKRSGLVNLFLQLRQWLDEAGAMLDTHMPLTEVDINCADNRRSAAKGTLILREYACEAIIDWWANSISIQKTFRGHFQYLCYREICTRRCNSATAIQCFVRSVFAAEYKKNLLEQQQSQWEQLWDEEKNLFYWYDTVSGGTTWEEPAVYRPMIRARRSQKLIQAWPLLGQAMSSNIQNEQMCVICTDEIATRACSCSDCIASSASGRKKQLCFICFHEKHRGLKKQTQKFEYIINKARPLMCGICELPSTRQCFGLRVSASAKYELKVLIESSSTTGGVLLSRVEFTDIITKKMKLPMSRARVNAAYEFCRGKDTTKSNNRALWTCFQNYVHSASKECGGHYCTECWEITHKSGSRLHHFFIGYKAMAIVCVECRKAPAQKRCIECQDDFCSACVLALHKHGRRSRHILQNIVESIPVGQVYCENCSVRGATEVCKTCGGQFCDACERFFHREKCDVTENIIANGTFPLTCSVCSNPPDKLCKDCGEVYCNLTWVGNPGCFQKLHVKGERLRHNVILLADIQRREKLPDDDSMSRQEDNVTEPLRLEQYWNVKQAEREERLYSEARSEFMKLFPQATPDDGASKKSNIKRRGQRISSLLLMIKKVTTKFDKPFRRSLHRKD